MPLQQFHRRVKRSKYKTWQVYFLLWATTISLGLYFEIALIRSLLDSLERITIGYEWLVILGLQGILVGFAAEFLYEHGDGYSKSLSTDFDSKDWTYVYRIGFMTLVAALVTVVVPALLETYTEYLAVQSVSATVAFGILLIHHEIKNWKPETEWPAIVAGVLMAIVPSIF